EQHRQHGEVAEAADDVNEARLAPLGERRVERRLVDEVVLQRLGRERVKQLLVGVREVRHRVVRELLDGPGGDAASIAFLWCAFHEYWASKCLAAISSDSSRSRSLRCESNRQ